MERGLAIAEQGAAAANGSAGAILRARAREAERRLERTLEQLAESTDRLAADRVFRSMLWGRMRLWYYGFYNVLLIFDQCPAATWVRGPRQWEALGRRVKEGASPIMILAPSRPGRPWPFKEIAVYDVNQTDGPALAETSGVYHGATDRLAEVEAAVGRLGVELREVETLGSLGPGLDVLGESFGGKILILKRLGPEARPRVIVHELAHELLHFAKGQRGAKGEPVGTHAIRETEADATAFLVLDQLGVQYNCPSYLVFHGGKGETILRSFKRILAAARAIRAAIEGETPRVSIPRLELAGRGSRARKERR